MSTGAPGIAVNPKTGGDRCAAMDASASASPVALLSYVIGERSSAERRRPSRSQIYKISGFAAIVVHIESVTPSPCVAVTRTTAVANLGA